MGRYFILCDQTFFPTSLEQSQILNLLSQFATKIAMHENVRAYRYVRARLVHARQVCRMHPQLASTYTGT